MKIILLQDLKNIGKKGDVKEVTDGYARNFLLPRKIAQRATEEAIKKNEIQKKEAVKKQVAEKQEAEKMLKKLQAKKISLITRQKKGKLFGSITAKKIAEVFKKEDLAISTDCIIIKKNIKKIGEHEIEIKLKAGIEGKVKIEVKGE